MSIADDLKAATSNAIKLKDIVIRAIPGHETGDVDASSTDANSLDATLSDAAASDESDGSVVDANAVDAADASPVCVIPTSAWSATVASPALPPETAPLVDSVLNVQLAASDIVYDPYTERLYASVPSSAGANGNSVARIDPTTGTIQGTVYIGSEPGLLAESADGQFLYVRVSLIVITQFARS